MEFTFQKILILAPHTDDGELGCGASIARFCSEGKEVHYAAFSLCNKSLPEGWPAGTLQMECSDATKALGIAAEQLRFFDFDVRTFDAHRQEILEEMVRMYQSVKPELVCIPSSSDQHQDHQVIHTEALRAFRNCSLLGYELPWNHYSFRSTFFIPVTAQHLEKKMNAVNAYRSQAHRNYMSEDFVRSLAKVRGIQCQSEYAESFEVYKYIH